MDAARLEYVALMVTRERRLALALTPESSWQDLYGLRMLRLEFPSAPYTPEGDAREQALALSLTTYGRPATPLPTPWTYGPSQRHAVDRQPASDPTTAPLLRYTRMLPREGAVRAAPQFVAIEIYHAELADDPAPERSVIAGVLWVSLPALRAIMSGARVGELLRQSGAVAQLAAGVTLPDEGMFFLPADYGERYLLRLAAKYGESALFAEPPGGM